MNAEEAVSPEKNWVLVVDDHRVNIRVQQMLFERLGFGCDAAVDGATAKLKLGEKKYDLLVVDFGLGDCYGWELIEHARGIDPGIRTVGWTAARVFEFAGHFHVVCDEFECDLDKRLVDAMLPKPSLFADIQGGIRKSVFRVGLVWSFFLS